MATVSSKEPQTKQKGSPAIMTDNGSDRPLTATEGTIFIESDGDNNIWQFKNGKWELKGGERASIENEGDNFIIDTSNMD